MCWDEKRSRQESAMPCYVGLWVPQGHLLQLVRVRVVCPPPEILHRQKGSLVAMLRGDRREPLLDTLVEVKGHGCLGYGCLWWNHLIGVGNVRVGQLWHSKEMPNGRGG